MLLALTAADMLDVSGSYVWRWKSPGRLTTEMNLGAWWSGMCLFAAALVCYEHSGTKNADFKFAWLGLAFILALLSLDEIGSIHERLHLIRYDRVFLAAGLLAVIPLCVVVKLFRRPETRSASVLICIAFGLFASVAVQERIEIAVGWSQLPLWVSALRAVLEEGTELVATLLILAAVVTQRREPGRTSVQAIVADLRNTPSVAIPVLVALVLNLAVCIIVLPNLTDIPKRGNPAVWYPAMLNVLLFSAAYSLGRDSTRWTCAAWKMIAAAFLFSSAALMTDVLRLVPGTPPYLMPDLWSRLVLLYGWQTLLIAWMMRREYLGAIHGAITVACAVALASLHFRFADQQGLVLLLYSTFACAVGLAVWSVAVAPMSRPGLPRSVAQLS